jgi:hypothetical protein
MIGCRVRNVAAADLLLLLETRVKVTYKTFMIVLATACLGFVIGIHFGKSTWSELQQERALNRELRNDAVRLVELLTACRVKQ